MTTLPDFFGDDDYDLDDDYALDDDWYEPDPEDWEQARAEEAYADHCDDVHGGADCDCRAPLRQRIKWRLRTARIRVAWLIRGRRYTDEPPF